MMKEVDNHEIMYGIIENPLTEIVQSLCKYGTLSDCGATVCTMVSEFCEYKHIDKAYAVELIQTALEIIMEEDNK